MKIALDIDDVLAAFTPHVHAHYGKNLERCDYWCFKTMGEKFGESWFTTDIQHLREFWDTLPTLSSPSDIDFEVACYMSSFPSGMFESRMNWLRDHGFPERPLVISRNKLKDCLHLGIDVMVDDKPATIQEMIGSPVKGIHFINHYAGFEPVGDYIVNNLKEVRKFL